MGGRALSPQIAAGKWLHYDEREETVHIDYQGMNGARMDASEGRKRPEL